MARLRSSTWPIVWVVILVLSFVVSGPGTNALAQDHSGHGAPPPAPDANCPWGDKTPSGALPPALPIWCAPLATGASTVGDGSNSWVDDFNHNLSNAEIGDGYKVFDNQGASVYRTEHFRHNDHWMVDVSGVDGDGPGPWNFGGAALRPDRSFKFQDGKLVVEADAAAGIDEYGGSAWPEIVVTTAPAPSGLVDESYAYGMFKGYWTVGCRLQSSRQPICAMYDDTGRSSGAGGRRFEISFFQHEGAAQVFGGGPFSPETDKAWRVCHQTDPDLNCRDRFRLELSRDTVTLFVNGTKYMEHRGLPADKQLPDALLQGDVYVYFASWINKPEAPVTRFHWDRLAVNPSASGDVVAASDPADAPTSHAGHGSPSADTGGPVAAGPAPLADPAPPAPSAPADSGASMTLTFDDRPGQDQPLSGQYPTGVVDWGSDTWYLSGPFGTFSTKSVSFNGSGLTSASFTVPTPRRLVKLDAFNGGDGPSTVRLTCAGAPDKELSLPAGQTATIETGWTDACASVTIASSNGWDTNFDNLVFDSN
jgi:hypothetical protein